MRLLIMIGCFVLILVAFAVLGMYMKSEAARRELEIIAGNRREANAENMMR